MMAHGRVNSNRSLKNLVSVALGEKGCHFPAIWSLSESPVRVAVAQILLNQHTHRVYDLTCMVPGHYPLIGITY